MLETQRAVHTARMRAELFKYPWWDFFLPPKANRRNITQSSSFLLHRPRHLHLYGSKISFCKAQLDYVLNLQEQLGANCSCICWYNIVKLSQVNGINKNGDKWASLWLLLGVPGLLVWWGCQPTPAEDLPNSHLRRWSPKPNASKPPGVLKPHGFCSKSTDQVRLWACEQDQDHPSLAACSHVFWGPNRALRN